MRGAWPWHAAYLSNFYQVFGGHETVLWTLAVENQFYVVWPIILLLMNSRRPVLIGVLLMSVSPISKFLLLAMGIWPRHELPTNQAEVLGIGCVLAALCFKNGKAFNLDWLTGRRRLALASLGLICLSIAAGLWLITRDYPHSLMRLFFLNLLCSVFYFAVVAFVAKGVGGFGGQILSNTIIRYVGIVSYGIYLLHTFLPEIVRQVFPAIPRMQLGVIVLALTFALSGLSWRYLENPMQKWAKSLSARLQRPHKDYAEPIRTKLDS